MHKTPVKQGHRKMGTVNNSIDLSNRLNNASTDVVAHQYNASIDPLGDRSID